jgi:hypothetical protein
MKTFSWCLMWSRFWKAFVLTFEFCLNMTCWRA